MSGTGQRFLKAGYKEPKPLIQVEGKPIIQHVVERFPKDSNFIFICNEDHLQTTNMRELLNSIAPNSEIISIKPHKKGPVYAVSRAYEKINDDEQCIVNYCDFSWRWNFENFKKTVSENECDGCVISYKGFHPHLLHPNLYASMREENNWMFEIKEKHTFTPNKMDCFQSSGTYYYKNGRILKNSFNALMEKNIELNGEYYVSLTYNQLVESGLKVYIYEIPFMLQWGTPEDLEEYLYWSNFFTKTK